MSDDSRNFRFDPEWRLTLFTLVLVPLMTALGFWQLARAEEKAALAEAFESRQKQPPTPLSSAQERAPEALAYLPVELTGHFREGEYFLLDNRTQGGRFGNEVLGVFELSGSDELVLVNRGWVPADPARLQWPEVPPVPGRVTLRGHVYVSPGHPYLLAETPLEDNWPRRIQAVEMNKLASVLPADRGLFPYPVRLDDGEAGALSVDWRVINVSPEKHTGYAVQWFAMAAVLLFFYLLRCSNLWQLLRGASRS